VEELQYEFYMSDGANSHFVTALKIILPPDLERLIQHWPIVPDLPLEARSVFGIN
jgi:hypothetical protein